MNCARCFSPSRLGRPAGRSRHSQQVKLVKIGEWDGHYRMECPVCAAKFWFPIPSEHTVVFKYANAH